MADQPQTYPEVMAWLKRHLSTMEFNEAYTMPKAGVRILVEGYEKVMAEIRRLEALVDTLENKATDSQNDLPTGNAEVQSEQELVDTTATIRPEPARGPGRPRGPRRQVPPTATDTAG